jgi:hypothetical protein
MDRGRHGFGDGSACGWNSGEPASGSGEHRQHENRCTIASYLNCYSFAGREERQGSREMNAKGKFLVGVLTALAMMLLTFALPRGGLIRDTAVVQFPMTVGIWAIFVLLFVKLK